MSEKVLLNIENLHVEVSGRPVIEGISLTINPSEMLGLVGESGCGKSVTALSIMRLLAEPPMRITKGAIRFDGVDVLSLDETTLEDLRGNKIAMIFQEPMTSAAPARPTRGTARPCARGRWTSVTRSPKWSCCIARSKRAQPMLG